MKFESFLKKSFLMKNYTINDVISIYDKDKNGKYSKDEVRELIKESIFDLGIFLGGGKSNLTEKMFKYIDKNKDETITIDEINTYLQKDFKGLKLDDLRQKNVKEVCKILDEAS